MLLRGPISEESNSSDQLKIAVLNFTRSLGGIEKEKTKKPKPKHSIKKTTALFLKLRGEPDCPSIQTPTDMDLTCRILGKNPLISQGSGTCMSWKSTGSQPLLQELKCPWKWILSLSSYLSPTLTLRVKLRTEFDWTGLRKRRQHIKSAFAF